MYSKNIHLVLLLSLSSVLLVSCLDNYKEVYNRKEVCFKLPLGPKRLEYEKIPKYMTISLTCHNQHAKFSNSGLKLPEITSVVYSIPKVWSEFCADNQNCCTKTYAQGRCLHEVDSGWKLQCQQNSSTCNIILPRFNMSDYCVFDFSCKNTSCWNRWVEVSYKCLLPVKNFVNKSVKINPPAKRSSNVLYIFLVLLLLAIGMFVYTFTRKRKLNLSYFYPNTPKVMAAYIILILVPLYIIYSATPTVS